MQPEDLYEHLRQGGAATLTHPATYAVAGGSVIAPARYAGGRGGGSQFVFETRYVDGEFRRTALIDSKQSQSNRAEEGLRAARRGGGPANTIPVIEVSYPDREPLNDLSLPHRAFDGHIRFATQDGQDVVKLQWYRELRNATHADLSPLFTTSPATIAFGGWDSTRKSGQVRLRGLVVSELFGIVDEDERTRVSRRSGARLDPLGQNIYLTPDEMEVALEGQREELSPKAIKDIEKAIAKARESKAGDARISASGFVVGGIPPGTETPFGVSVPEVRRARTYSLAGLRRLRFGGSADDDVAARGALLAMLLLGMACADADPDLRAYCDVAAPRGEMLLDSETVELELSLDRCSAFLEEAISRLPKRLAWNGQVQSLDGDPAFSAGAQDDSPADEEE